MLFISYSTIDRAIAAEIYQRLTEFGYHLPFLDYHPDAGIPGGSNWQEELRWQLKVARGMVVLCSKNWQESKWCFAELDRAKEFGKAIVPLNLDQMQLPQEVSAYQSIPFHDRNDESYDRLRIALEQAKLAAGDDFFWPRDECPYPGLAPFQEEHAGVYFGRDEELSTFNEKYLREMRESSETRMVYVIGPSGSGKSSFVRAGVLPRLKFKSGGQWKILTVFRWAELKRDGQTWPERLASDIQRLYGEHPQRPNWNAEQLATRYAIGDSVDSIATAAGKFVFDVKDLLTATAGKLTTPLIVLDQFEELLAPGGDVRGPLGFLRFMRHCLTADDSPCRAVATVRSDFLPTIQEHPELIAWNERTQLFRLDLLKNERLFDIVRRPAELVDVRFENDALINRIVSEAESSDALPLLAFTLKQFYDTCADDRLLTADEYNSKLGGLNKCLQRVAQGVLSDEHSQQPSVDPAAENSLRICFVKHLVRYQDGQDKTEDVFVKQTANWDDLPKEARPLLEKMNSEAFRLVRIDQRDDSPATIEVTHESLFRQWDTLKHWLDARRDLLRWRSDVKRSQEAAEASDQNWTGLTNTQLAIARDWRKTRRDELSEDELNWIGWAIFWRGLWFTAAVVAFIFVSTLALVAWSLKTTADDLAISESNAKERATDNVYLSEMKLADQARRDGHLEALKAYLRPWERVVDQRDRRAFEWYYLDAQTRIPFVQLESYDGPVTSLAYSSTRDYVACGAGGANGVIQVWSVPTREPVFTTYPAEHLDSSFCADTVSALAFSPDGTLLAAGFGHGAVTIWDLDSRSVLARYGVDRRVTCLGFGGPANKLLAVGTKAVKPPGTAFVGVWDWGAANDTEPHWQNGVMRLQIEPSISLSALAIGLHSAGTGVTVAFGDGRVFSFPVNDGGAMELAVPPSDSEAGDGGFAAFIGGKENSLYVADRNDVKRVSLDEPDTVLDETDLDFAPVSGLAVAPDGVTLLGNMKQTVQLTRWLSGKRLDVLGRTDAEEDKPTITTACFASSNGQAIAWGESSGGLYLRSADPEDQQKSDYERAVVEPWVGNDRANRHAVWSPNGNAVAIVAAYDGELENPATAVAPPMLWRVTVHETQSGRQLIGIPDVPAHASFHVAMSNEHIALNMPNRVAGWDFREGEALKGVEPEEPFRAIAISPDSRQLFAVSDRELVGDEGCPVEIWDWENGVRTAPLSSARSGSFDEGSSVRLAVSPEGSRLAAAWNRRVTVWDLPNGKVAQTFSLPVAVSERANPTPSLPDVASEIFVTSTHINCVIPGYGVQRIDLADGSVTIDSGLPPHLARASHHIACHPDGTRIALAVMRGKIRLADGQGREVLSLEGLEGDVTDLEFSPDGQNLVAAYRESGVRIWRAPRDIANSEGSMADAMVPSP